MLRKAAVNHIKRYRERAESKRSASKIMFGCLLNSYFISYFFKIDFRGLYALC